MDASIDSINHEGMPDQAIIVEVLKRKELAVATGIYPLEQLRGFNPDYILKDLANTKRILSILFEGEKGKGEASQHTNVDDRMFLTMAEDLDHGSDS